MKTLGWTWLPVVCALTAVVGWAADIIPKREVRKPGFEILGIKEHRVDLEDDSDHQIYKHYAVDVACNGEIWRVVVNQENKTVMQWIISKRQ